MSKLITAMPYRIGPGYKPECVKTPEAMAAFITNYAPLAKKVNTGTVFDLSVVDDAKPGQKLFFVYERETLHYYMELNKVLAPTDGKGVPSVLRRRSAYQGSVWRSPQLGALAPGFPSRIFWKYLCTTTRNVLSDSSQSDAGESFWKTRIAEAMVYGHEVYGLDCELVGQALRITTAVRILLPNEVDTYYTEGEDYNGHYKRLAICK